jgi:hypothetical protein
MDFFLNLRMVIIAVQNAIIDLLLIIRSKSLTGANQLTSYSGQSPLQKWGF